MKAHSSLPSSSGSGEDFDLADIFRAVDLADLIEELRRRDDDMVMVISSDGESCRISTLGDVSRLELLGLLALADEAVADYDS